MGNGKSVKVQSIPNCDFCEKETPAKYDGKTIFGYWGYMCNAHFLIFGYGLGTGIGQELIFDENGN
jgi:hypothetical protein